MKILCVGDVVSHEGIDCLFDVLPSLKRKYAPDVVIVNGENSAIGNGIDKTAYDMIINAGADVVTGGNHSFQKNSAGQLHESEKRLLRPGNIEGVSDGQWQIKLNFGKNTLRVINLSGSLYIKNTTNPFEFLQKALKTDTDCITVVDFHAEATSEKRALGFMADGRVSLLFGTHTHVQTNDAQILPNGTGYITDVGMTGVKHSVLGKDVDVCVNNFITPQNRLPIKDAKGGCILSGVFADIDDNTKKCVFIEVINIDN